MKKKTNKHGGKKSNGHKAHCKCPICKNMSKKGGQEPINDGVSLNETDGKEIKATDDEYDALDSVGGTRKHKKYMRSKTVRAKRSHRRY
jgi:hypothetical protein